MHQPSIGHVLVEYRSCISRVSLVKGYIGRLIYWSTVGRYISRQSTDSRVTVDQ